LKKLCWTHFTFLYFTGKLNMLYDYKINSVVQQL
jgi:hypothetical protein